MSNDADRNVRVQILVPPRSAQRLDRLVKQTESASIAEVVRNALRLYEAVIDADMKGRPIFQRIDGQMTPLLMMGPYAPPESVSMKLPMGTRDEFDATERKTLREAMGYIVLDPPGIRHFTDDGAWIETPLFHDPEIDVAEYEEGETRGDVDHFIVRIKAQGWRTYPDSPGIVMESFFKRALDFLRGKS